MRNSILRRLAKIYEQGAVDTSVMKVHWVELHDDLTVSLLQARLIELNLPISVEIGTRD